MQAETTLMPAKFFTRLLVVASAMLFWCVPFSPLISIAAVRATDNTMGWPRHVARSGAMLTVAWVTLLVVAIAWMLYVVVWNPALA